MDQYLPLVTLLVLGVVFTVMAALMTRALAPHRPNAAKAAPYECGIVPRRDPPERFPVRFYLVAMIFIIFDIEIIFLYPYAVVHRQLGTYGVWEMVIFAAVVFAAFVYLIANGALDWGPAKRLGRIDDASIVSASRTARSTVRRVGLEGRYEERAPDEPSEPGAVA